MEERRIHFMNTAISSGAIWNKNIEDYRATGDSQIESRGIRSLSKQNCGSKPASKKTSFMICDILSKDEIPSEFNSSGMEPNFRKDTDEVLHSPGSNRSTTPDAGNY